MAPDIRERGIDLLVPIWHFMDLAPQRRGNRYANLDYRTKSTRPPRRVISNARSIVSTARIATVVVSQAQLSPHPATSETALSRIKAHIEALLIRGNAVSISDDGALRSCSTATTHFSLALAPRGE
jgi:hypothetical protein